MKSLLFSVSALPLSDFCKSICTAESDLNTLTSEVVPGVGGQTGVFVLPAVVPGGRTLPGTLGLHLDHQGNPLLLVSYL